MSCLLSVYVDRLKKYPAFLGKPSAEELFTCDFCSSELARLREEFRPELHAGEGDTFKRTLRLMDWVHHELFSAGDAIRPAAFNAREILRVRKTGSAFCTHYSTVMTELLLSIGISARPLYCVPEAFDCDSHMGVLVYLPETGRCFFADPTFNTYFEKNGRPMDIFEIRKSYAEGKPPSFRHINIDKQWELYCAGERCETYDEWYRLYMAKNVFRFMSPARSAYGCMDVNDSAWIIANPIGFDVKNEYDRFENAVYIHSAVTN